MPKDKFKDYVRYAEHCLNMVAGTTDQELRSLQRDMAAEWLRLADGIGAPASPGKYNLLSPGKFKWDDAAAQGRSGQQPTSSSCPELLKRPQFASDADAIIVSGCQCSAQLHITGEHATAHHRWLELTAFFICPIH